MALAKTSTGGAFDPTEPNIYFIASNIDSLRLAAPVHDHVLIAVNEIKPADIPVLEQWIGAGKRVFIDSGIFHLTNEHARAHNVSMDQALALAPEAIDGFRELWDRYLAVVQRLGQKAWGYIELDQGGLEHKRRTRAKLEALGLRPIPVYHPLNDGWDYFDELSDRYDRICFGNVVQADIPTRKKLVATAWERHRRHPDLWIHLLGLTPNELLYALPINSGDSSSWLSSVRWSGYIEHAAGRTLGPMPRNFQYRLGSETDSPEGRAKANLVAAYGAAMMQRNWRTHLRRMQELGAQIYPPVKGADDADGS
jgi:hypothetical protein